MSPKLGAGSSRTEGRRRHVPPREVDAEQVCLLDEETRQQWEEGDQVVLRIIRPDGNTE